MKKVKLGIIGVGNIGTTHVKNITEGRCPELEITAVADRREERREWARGVLPASAAVFEEGEALLQSGLCEAVLIAVPHYQHPVLAQAAFRQGLHVMCEKPAGVYTKAVAEMNEAAEKSGLTFGMMFNQRTNCLYRKMREMVQGGELGDLKRVNWIITDWYRTQIYYDSGDWRATWAGEGGGVLLNQCPHQLDLLQWICGLPVKVQAFCHEGKWHDIEVEDDVTAYLEFANGATGVFVTTTGDAPGTNRFEVTGTKGKLVCENDTLSFWKLQEDEREFCRSAKEGFQKPPCEMVPVETDGENPQHAGVLNAFAARILRGEPLVAEGKEGIRGLTLSNAMHLSSWLEKPVEIPFDEELFLQELNKRRASSRRKEGGNITFSTEGSY
ncbi:gfo/Idh/MocA family oxidoreductase [Neglecta sp. X4]|uniref:Gfo/Idh/MocA family protein n=1 Tax=unclassified Neglectibacter TaxID=2632164 RepID=UPI00136B739F|nr:MULTISPECIES: Gfo/Idh/MocA family oxidoreductase [unclassified Neglectibacter]NBI18329.1 gfo/Idh/MocA family oxidoreductase [Neglectibacter sp. 59]NBJ74003.1 gfo/Idh/MocA family oxidoreductase [Neglectibacter sp. X4]NCE81833.1 gfo/Idh/MocA family oxidoreductase [Neglectibacter sp. X58]